jgi:hypothetical protein
VAPVSPTACAACRRPASSTAAKATKTCPKVIEHFGSAEVWALKLTPEWVGTDGKNDIPIPKNVRRYYIASSTHGGGAGGFNSSLTPTPAPNCPGNNYGNGILPANPVPHTQTVNALRVHFRNWVMNDVLPPDSVYPTLNGKKADVGKTRGKNVPDLVEANKQAMGFRRFRSRVCARPRRSPASSTRCSTTTGGRSSTTPMHRASRPTRRRRSSRSSTCWSRGPTRTATKSAACRWC